MKYVVFACFLLFLSCGAVTIGPFTPSNPVYCRSDADCLEREVCQFPGVGRRPVCVPALAGENEAYP
jgi:hypothetical protein